MELPVVLTAFGLTFFAGLSTGIGSALVFFAKKTNTKLLSFSLGFSAGVMIYVSFAELLFKANDSLALTLGEKSASWITICSFFGGIALIALIDRLVPSFENPHEVYRVENMDDTDMAEKSNKLFRLGFFAALAIAIHNFPEGLATFSAALSDPSVGIAIAIAIAIHNIPEGIAVAIPIYYATGNRRKAFNLSFLSGLSEPCGALIGYLILRPFFNEVLFGVLFGAIAGIMVFISLDQLLPAANEYGEHHLAIYGLVLGMAVMAVSLVLFV